VPDYNKYISRDISYHLRAIGLYFASRTNSDILQIPDHYFFEKLRYYTGIREDNNNELALAVVNRYQLDINALAFLQPQIINSEISKDSKTRRKLFLSKTDLSQLLDIDNKRIEFLNKLKRGN